eukprot:symbB.v1.2.040512.t1/scaffold7289.1/size12111/1
MEDDSLALLLQQAFEQDPYKLDDPVAAFAWSDTLYQTVVKTSEGMFAIDTAALPFMDMPSYSREIPLNNAVLAFTHSSFLTSAPRTLDHVAKGDYLAIWKDVDALYFMSRRCVCCGASFTFELAAKHTASHWGDITNLPDGIYPDCASHFFANFLALPWFQNTPCYRAVLHQTLLLRLLIGLWEDGSLGCGDASNVEASLIRRRIAAGLQASQDRLSATFEKKPQTQQQSARSRSRSRHQSGEDVESPGDQARGHVERAAATATVHPSLERRNGVVDPPNDEKQHGVAPGSGENTSTPPKTGTSALHHPATESAAPTSGETRGRDLPEWDEKPAAHRTAHLPLPDMVSEISAPYSEQGQSSGEGGTAQFTSAAVRSQCQQRSHTQVSHHEESTSGTNTCRKQLFPLDAHDISHDVSCSAAVVLSQHLASRGSGCEEAVSGPLTSSQANRSTTPAKILRCCLNPEGLFCWLNAASLGLCWLGLVCDCSTSCWSISWLFDELTKVTPQPLALRHGDSTFHQMLREWAEHHLLDRQQDVADFLAFCLPRLQPAFYSAEWMPRWAFRDGTLLEDHQEKGTRFAPLMFHVNDPIMDQDLLSLVNHWHDENGHARVLNGTPPGLCIHMSRLVGEDWSSEGAKDGQNWSKGEMDIMRLEIIVTIGNWLGQSTSGNASALIQLDQAPQVVPVGATNLQIFNREEVQFNMQTELRESFECSDASRYNRRIAVDWEYSVSNPSSGWVKMSEVPGLEDTSFSPFALSFAAFSFEPETNHYFRATAYFAGLDPSIVENTQVLIFGLFVKPREPVVAFVSGPSETSVNCSFVVSAKASQDPSLPAAEIPDFRYKWSCNASVQDRVCQLMDSSDADFSIRAGTLQEGLFTFTALVWRPFESQANASSASITVLLSSTAPPPVVITTPWLDGGGVGPVANIMGSSSCPIPAVGTFRWALVSSTEVLESVHVPEGSYNTSYASMTLASSDFDGSRLTVGETYEYVPRLSRLGKTLPKLKAGPTFLAETAAFQ